MYDPGLVIKFRLTHPSVVVININLFRYFLYLFVFLDIAWHIIVEELGCNCQHSWDCKWEKIEGASSSTKNTTATRAVNPEP